MRNHGNLFISPSTKITQILHFWSKFHCFGDKIIWNDDYGHQNHTFLIKNWRIIAKSLLKLSKMHTLSNLDSYLVGRTRFRVPKLRIFCIFDQYFIVLVTIFKSLLKDYRRNRILEITTILMFFSLMGKNTIPGTKMTHILYFWSKFHCSGDDFQIFIEGL